MATEIEKIHNQIFKTLMKYHEKDDNFLFAFRQINRNARLEKGYWFLGDDTYLAVSFWRGKDWITRMPKISFIVRVDGSTLLEFNSKYTSNKMDYFDESMINAVNASPMGYDYGYRKYYPEFAGDYVKSLESFIEHDKLIIDKYVLDGNAFNSAALEYTDPIEFIWPGDFKKQLDNVLKYQKILKENEKKSGYLVEFSIKNFAPITDISIKKIEKDCKWIFITGENGAGKSSILKALAAGLFRNNDNNEPIATEYGDFKIVLGLNTATANVEHHVVSFSDDIKDKTIIPKGLAVYGPVRLLTQGSLNSNFMIVDEQLISKKKTFGLFNPIGILRDISGSYILAVKSKHYQMELVSLIENLEYIIPNVLRVVAEPLGEGHKLRYIQKLPNAQADPQGVYFENLPSGTRNFAALILDLLIRFAEQQPGVTDPANYRGIVLIDEIDLHLHPKMQKEIVEQLSATFPNIQFIVTTHSPIPLLGAPKNSVFINVYRDEQNNIAASKLDIDITNLLPNAILSSPIFDFESIINVNHDKKERLITEDNYDDAVFYKILTQKIKENTLKPE